VFLIECGELSAPDFRYTNISAKEENKNKPINTQKRTEKLEHKNL
jgi:hypothetical protein